MAIKKVPISKQRYIIDTTDDLTHINTDFCHMGDSVYIIETASLYMLNSQKQWIKQTISKNNSDSSSMSEDELLAELLGEEHTISNDELDELLG